MRKKIFILFSSLLIMFSALLVPISASTGNNLDGSKPFVYSIPFSITFHDVLGVYNIASALVPPILESETTTMPHVSLEYIEFNGTYFSIENTYFSKEVDSNGDPTDLISSMIIRPAEDFRDYYNNLVFTISSVGGFVPNTSENDLKIAFNGDVNIMGFLTISTVTEDLDGNSIITHTPIYINETISLGGGYFSLAFLTNQYVDPTLDYYFISEYSLDFTLYDVDYSLYDTPEIYLDMLLLREDIASGNNFLFFDDLRDRLEVNYFNGYSVGYGVGFDEGVLAGAENGLEITDFTSFMATAVSGFFDAEIFPGFSLTGAFVMVLSVVLLVTIVRMLAD